MDLEAFLRLLTPAGRRALRDAAEIVAGGADEVRAATLMRRTYDAATASAALTQVMLRRRAVAKFGPDAERMYFTPDGLEQATRPQVAGHRAARIAALGPPVRVADVCCGIGGDLIALSRQGCAVDAIDLDPLTVAVARANAEALGLVNHVVPAAELRDHAQRLAQRIAKNAPLSVRAAKATVYLSRPDVYDRAEEIWEPVYRSTDAQEGPAAFREKRAPVWKGE